MARTHALAAAFLLAAIATGAAKAADANPDAALGRWLTRENAGVVEVSKCGGGLCGVVVTSDRIRAEPSLKDARNKDPALRNRPIKGLALFQEMKGGPQLWRGRVYNPADGGTYAGSIRVADENTLKLQGCIVWPLCKTETWTRLR